MTPAPSSSRIRAWLELCRISNLPTIWTNVLTGSAIAGGFGLHLRSEETGELVEWAHPWELIGVMAGIMSLFYIGGMVLNDLADADIDAVERPHRPIPSGRVSRSAALNFVMLCFVDGLLATWCFLPEAMPYVFFLILAIIAYDFAHKRFKSSVLLMGVCRGLVVLAPASLAIDFSFDRYAIPVSLALGAYVVGITIIARGEVENRMDDRKWLAPVMPVVILAMVAVLKPIDWRWPALTAFVFALWMSRAVRFVFAQPPKTVPAVLTWLSGICLVDAVFLAMLGAPWLALIAAACFALTAWGHRKILGT